VSDVCARLRLHLAGFAIVAVALTFCATRAVELPGVYMDAVNPDYLVVRVFTWHREPMAAWVLPGNYLLDARFPILVSIHHGSQHFWLGLPLFWLLGTTVESLRIVHALFALGVLAALYGLLALGIAALASASPRTRLVARTSALAAFPLLVAANVQGHREEMAKLVATRGVGLFSDAVNRLPADLMARSPRPFMFFPDWGLALPFAYLTRASVPSTSDGTPEMGRRLLCAGRDVSIALIDGDRAARREEWRTALAWEAPVVEPYRQADGRVVFELVTFKGRAGAPSCTDPGAAGAAAR